MPLCAEADHRLQLSDPVILCNHSHSYLQTPDKASKMLTTPHSSTHALKQLTTQAIESATAHVFSSGLSLREQYLQSRNLHKHVRAIFACGHLQLLLSCIASHLACTGCTCRCLSWNSEARKSIVFKTIRGFPDKSSRRAERSFSSAAALIQES